MFGKTFEEHEAALYAAANRVREALKAANEADRQADVDAALAGNDFMVVQAANSAVRALELRKPLADAIAAYIPIKAAYDVARDKKAAADRRAADKASAQADLAYAKQVLADSKELAEKAKTAVGAATKKIAESMEDPDTAPAAG
jgi:colicin import membrane protein